VTTITPEQGLKITHADFIEQGRKFVSVSIINIEIYTDLNILYLEKNKKVAYTISRRN